MISDLVIKQIISSVSRLQARIYSLAMNENIFLKDPANLEAYEIWMSTFDLEDKNDEMADLLTNNPHLQLQYSQLVPAKVSHLVFWHRFYFQVYLISIEEEAMAREDARTEEKNAERARRGNSETGSGSSGSQSQSKWKSKIFKFLSHAS